MFSKLIIEVGENKNHSFRKAQRIKEDKGEDKDFPKLPLVTSSTQNSRDNSLIHNIYY